MTVLLLGLAPDSLAVGDTRAEQIDLHAEPALEFLRQDFNVGRSLGPENLLFEGAVGYQAECRVLFVQFVKTVADLFLITLGLGPDGGVHNGIREGRRRYGNAEAAAAEGIASMGLFQLDQDADVADRHRC